MGKILWLESGMGYQDATKYGLQQSLKKVGISPASVFYQSLAKGLSGNPIYNRTQTIKDLRPEMKEPAHAKLRSFYDRINPDVIVCNDLACLWLITGDTHYSLNLCRGSVYFYADTPVIVLDELANRHHIAHGDWAFLNDLQKVKRWLEKKQRPEPKFNYQVCHTIPAVAEAVSFLTAADVVSIDIETKSDFITCGGYTGICGRVVKSFVIPFFNSTRASGCHWDTEAEECEVWAAIRDIHSSPAVKVFQNGSYDTSYFIRYRAPLYNYIGDTLHLFHSVWAEAPKKINFIASLLCDYYRYWKDENKGDEETSIAGNVEAQERYWRYNALDTYYTLLAFYQLCRLVTLPSMKWAADNYRVEFSLQVGPCLWGMMQGVRMRLDRQRLNYHAWMEEHEQALVDIRTMVDDQEFNPNSPDQVAQLIYDVLRCEPIKMRGKAAAKAKRGTDEKLLMMIAESNPFAEIFIDKIFATKKPRNNASKYGQMRDYNGRFIYNLSAAGTKFGRLASKSHPFWYGTNAQNIPSKLRDMLVADEGCVLFDCDYSQSDARFVAWESEEPRYIQTMLSGKDSHSVHAAHFFKKEYDEIYAGAQDGAEWVVHPITGVRQITKRAVHGANFQMQAITLLVTMKKKPVVGAAKVLGFHDAHKWTMPQLIKFVDKYLLEEYHVLYPGLRPWFKSSATDAVRNANKATCAFGRTHLFFGDILGTPAIQRELSSFFGQGGTAGNVNRVMLHIFYKRRDLIDQGLQMLLQVHDSLIFQSPKHLAEQHIAAVREIMEQPFSIKGRELYVPTDCKAGWTWGDGCVKIKNGKIDWQKLDDAEAKINTHYAEMRQKQTQQAEEEKVDNEQDLLEDIVTLEGNLSVEEMLDTDMIELNS